MAANAQPDIATDKLAELYFHKQLTLVEIEKELSGTLSATAAGRRLRRAGYKLRPKSARPRLSAEDIMEIVRLCREGHSDPKIAQRFSVSSSRIHQIRATAGVKANRVRDVENEAVVKDALDGMSIKELAIKHKVGKRRISGILYAAGVNRPRGGGAHRGYRPLHVDAEPEIVALYLQGVSGVQLGKRYNVTHGTIYDVLRKHGVQIRDTSEAGKVTQNRPELIKSKRAHMKEVWKERKKLMQEGMSARTKKGKDQASKGGAPTKYPPELLEAAIQIYSGLPEEIRSWSYAAKKVIHNEWQADPKAAGTKLRRAVDYYLKHRLDREGKPTA